MPNEPIDVEFEDPPSTAPSPVRCVCPCCPVYVDAGTQAGMCAPCRTRCLPAVRAAHASHASPLEDRIAIERARLAAEKSAKQELLTTVLAEGAKAMRPAVQRNLGRAVDSLFGNKPKGRRR